MWDYEPTTEFSRRTKRFAKRHARELTAVSVNLERVRAALREGANPLDLPLGCIHREQAGVLAVDQSGGGKSLAQTRLYFYLDRDTETIHLITVGDKGTQADDVKFAAQFVKSLAKSKEKE